jgi:hypothetical protein
MSRRDAAYLAAARRVNAELAEDNDERAAGGDGRQFALISVHQRKSAAKPCLSSNSRSFALIRG